MTQRRAEPGGREWERLGASERMDVMSVDDQPQPERASGVPDPADTSGEQPGSLAQPAASAEVADSAEPSDSEEFAAPGERVYTAEVRTRANPVAFLILGAVVGAIAAVIWTFLYPDGTYTHGQVLGFLLVFLIPLGAGLFATIGMIVDLFVYRRRTPVRLDAPEHETHLGETPEVR